MKLLVTQPFGDRARGSEVTAADEVKAILASEQAAFVVRVADDAPAVEPVEAPALPAPRTDGDKTDTNAS